MVGFSTVCVSTVFVGTYFVYDAGGYCSGDRTHWGCVCGKHCDGKDYVKDPGLHRTLLGDGLACLCAGLLGGPPVTTYSEVTGAMSLTKVTNPQVIRIAAITAILFSVIGKVSALLKSIPSAVLGGIMLLLFGTIACAGIANLVNNCIDLSRTRNIIIVSLTLTIGIGGAVLAWGEFSPSGIGLAALVGVGLNLVLPREEMNEKSKKRCQCSYSPQDYTDK